MVKIQQNMKGVLYCTIPSQVAKAFGWRKGTELFPQPDSLRRELILKELQKQ